jgi:hypothetical protein
LVGHPRAVDRGRDARRALILIVFAAAAVRAVPLVSTGGRDLARISTADSRAYLELAASLQSGGEFVRRPPEGEARIGNPWPTEVFRTPGYPAGIAALFAMGGSLRALVLLQIAIGAATVWLCGSLAGRWIGPRGGLAAAALLALDPLHLVYANMIMSDVAFAALVALSVWLAAGGVPAGEAGGAADDGRSHTRAIGWAVAAGAVLSIATAVRPVAAAAGVPIAAYAAWRGGRRAAGVALLAVSLVFPAAWVARNAAVNGVVTLSNANTFNLYLLAGSRVKARAEGLDQATAFTQVVDAAVAELVANGPNRWAESLRRAGGWIFLRYPRATAAEAVRGLLEMTLSGERRMLFRLAGDERGDEGRPGINQGKRGLSGVVDYLRNTQPIETVSVVVQLLVNAAIAALAAVGLLRLWHAGRRPEASLVAALVAYFLLASLTVASARMRMPVSFALDIAAAAAVVRWR